MVQVSADQFTKRQLDLSESVTEDKAKLVMEQLRDNNNYKVSLGDGRLIIQRFLRD
jgi:hypothetical protein